MEELEVLIHGILTATPSLSFWENLPAPIAKEAVWGSDRLWTVWTREGSFLFPGIKLQVTGRPARDLGSLPAVPSK